jgi:hypothetical protein
VFFACQYLVDKEMTVFTPKPQTLDLHFLIRENVNYKEQLRVSNGMILQAKINKGEFDVFLCYNDEDKIEMRAIDEYLKQEGIYPWLDEEQLRPGIPWQRELEKQIDKVKSVAVFVGKDGIGPWQRMEMEGFLRRFVERDEPCPVVPVILPDSENTPELPIFLRGMTWVDFRKIVPDPMKQLIWGITGRRD